MHSQQAIRLLARSRNGGTLDLGGFGYTGYFGDPDGYRWEIAWNPGAIGQLVLP